MEFGFATAFPAIRRQRRFVDKIMNIKLENKIQKLPEATFFGLYSNQKNRPEIKNLAKSLAILTLKKIDMDFVSQYLSNEKNWTEKTVRILPLASDPTKKFVFFGLGEKKAWQRQKADIVIRRIILVAKDIQVKNLTINLADFDPNDKQADFIKRTVINLVMADFNFNQYKEEPKEGWPEINEVIIYIPKIDRLAKKSLAEGLIIGRETNHCRILANTPGGDMTPAKLARAALDERKKAGQKFKVEVLDEKMLKKLSMGGLLGVSRGSHEKPKFIILEYQGKIKSKKRLLFIGKGVTFDSGGLNLKPESGISEMHMDMSGGAAVIHAISAIAQLNLPINIIGLIPAAENMPSGSSYRPGDILKIITKKTVEVLNTDAEGRIILADALGYAQRYKPELIVDLATLTGAAIVALGQRASALFTTDQTLENLARQVGDQTGDLVWPLPLWDDYAEDIKGTFGDVANVTKNHYGGAISGAIFLKQFVGDFPWIHLDIAPTMTTIDNQFLAKGASGVGVRFLVELAKRYCDKV